MNNNYILIFSYVKKGSGIIIAIDIHYTIFFYSHPNTDLYGL